MPHQVLHPAGWEGGVVHKGFGALGPCKPANNTPNQVLHPAGRERGVVWQKKGLVWMVCMVIAMQLFARTAKLGWVRVL
jgi:hypothetical protein